MCVSLDVSDRLRMNVQSFHLFDRLYCMYNNFIYTVDVQAMCISFYR